MPTWLLPLAPPPPRTRPTEQPRSILASREKSEWTSGWVKQDVGQQIRMKITMTRLTLMFSSRSLEKCSERRRCERRTWSRSGSLMW